MVMAHTVPQGTPTILINFIVLIEITRNLIRPITLCVRLTANMIAGHLLISLLRSFIIGLTTPYHLLLRLTPIILTTLERAVALIQAYVFATLVTLYAAETQYAKKISLIPHSRKEPVTTNSLKLSPIYSTIHTLMDQHKKRNIPPGSTSLNPNCSLHMMARRVSRNPNPRQPQGTSLYRPTGRYDPVYYLRSAVLPILLLSILPQKNLTKRRTRSQVTPRRHHPIRPNKYSSTKYINPPIFRGVCHLMSPRNPYLKSKIKNGIPNNHSNIRNSIYDTPSI